MQRGARPAFLSLSHDLDNYNTRVIFLELVELPQDVDIEAHCRLEVLARWMASENGKFYRRDPDSGIIDFTTTFGACEVRKTYFERRERLRKNVETFEQWRGTRFLRDIARRNAEQDDVITELLGLREAHGIPSKVPSDVDPFGRLIRCDYAPLAAPLPGDARILDVIESLGS